MPLTDQELVSAIAKKSESAFKQLVESFQSKVYSICLGYVKNEADAEDMAQEVFIEVYRSINKFKGGSELGTWIYRIAVNKSLELLRKQKAKKRLGFLSSLFGKEEVIGRDYSDYNHPGVKLENKERANILFSHIERLPESQCTVFQLQQLQGLSYKEIADIMNTSVSSVESLMFRARKNLQKSLRKYYENEQR